jgi:hypothetical protein
MEPPFQNTPINALEMEEAPHMIQLVSFVWAYRPH